MGLRDSGRVAGTYSGKPSLAAATHPQGFAGHTQVFPVESRWEGHGASGCTGLLPEGTSSKTTWKTCLSTWKFMNEEDVEKPLANLSAFLFVLIGCHQ